MSHIAPKQHRSEETFERILAAAERLYALRRSVEVSVREICEEAGASRSSFYARFSDAQGLVHACYDRFAARVAALLDDLERDWPGARPPGAELADFTPFMVSRFVDFWHAQSRLVQAFRSGEAFDAALRGKREALDRELVRRTLEIACRLHPRLDPGALASALQSDMTMLAAAFRSALDYPEQLSATSPVARESVVEGLTGLVLRAVDARAVPARAGLGSS